MNRKIIPTKEGILVQLRKGEVPPKLGMIMITDVGEGQVVDILGPIEQPYVLVRLLKRKSRI